MSPRTSVARWVRHSVPTWPPRPDVVDCFCATMCQTHHQRCTVLRQLTRDEQVDLLQKTLLVLGRELVGRRPARQEHAIRTVNVNLVAKGALLDELCWNESEWSCCGHTWGRRCHGLIGHLERRQRRRETICDALETNKMHKRINGTCMTWSVAIRENKYNRYRNIYMLYTYTHTNTHIHTHTCTCCYYVLDRLISTYQCNDK